MKLHHTLICFFLLSLQDEKSGLISAQVYPRIEGENFTVNCLFTFSRNRKYFCRDKCEQKDTLIETNGVRAREGKYSIEYKRERELSVTITQLAKSDSGVYGCGLGFTSPVKFEIIVVDALLMGGPSDEHTLHTQPGGNIVVACFFNVFENRKYFCKEECKRSSILVETTGNRNQRGRHSIRYVKETSSGSSGVLYVNMTQLSKSDSGQYRCGLDSSFYVDPYRSFEVTVTEVPSASTSTTTPSSNSNSGGSAPPGTRTTDVLLYVGLTLIVMVMLSLSVLIVCRKVTSKAKEPPAETEFTSVTETNQVYENIRECRRSRSPPAEDDWSRLTYSELDFSNRGVGSSRRALRSDGDNVVYSVPRVQASSEASRAEDHLSVYSNVT
ncbi:polymeric immunoglobulin receptor-like isoform X2 [Plectropomus leopardus]|uniref:polymeric immunoglobulin receptor-like isoform X2 n=1 Tax=Plectropomus leopardus TaxID=160734 RepID=UPI001C4C5465|nr:polymeric immunoglobulin receptor-like isoform X2 [Plectropomus leopardus]